jgi:uncharacterized protein YbjQ (UPF0145 family)
MRTSTTSEIEGGRISTPIGRIEAVSTWHAVTIRELDAALREHALRNLIRRAEDVDADAIVGLEFEIDGGVAVSETGVALARVRATGIAVRIAA